MKKILFPLFVLCIVLLTACAGSPANPDGSTNTGDTNTDGVVNLSPASSDTGVLFESPVARTSVVNEASSWLIAEPGVIGSETTLWDIPDTEDARTWNCPEGGFFYASLGEGRIVINGHNFYMAGAQGLNYLFAARCRIDDTIVDSDLNIDVTISEFNVGNAIWAYLPNGAYISKNWFMDQLEASTTGGYTNCGATGCSHVRIILFDVDSGHYDIFDVNAGDLTNWVQAGQ